MTADPFLVVLPGLVIDALNQTVTWRGKLARFTHKEMQMIAVLVRVLPYGDVTRLEWSRRVWPWLSKPPDGFCTLLSRLRRKSPGLVASSSDPTGRGGKGGYHAGLAFSYWLNIPSQWPDDGVLRVNPMSGRVVWKGRSMFLSAYECRALGAMALAGTDGVSPTKIAASVRPDLKGYRRHKVRDQLRQLYTKLGPEVIHKPKRGLYILMVPLQRLTKK